MDFWWINCSWSYCWWYFSGNKYAYSTKSLANRGSCLSKAQLSLDNAWKPLSNVKNLANIARTVGQVATNYNAAYNNLKFAGVNNIIVNLSFPGMYAGSQFGLKQLMGYGINQI